MNWNRLHARHNVSGTRGYDRALGLGALSLWASQPAETMLVVLVKHRVRKPKIFSVG